MSERKSVRYRGRRFPSGCVIERREAVLSGKERWARVSPLKSLRLMNHSPTGFEWGYTGSGPAQTALALLLDYTRDRAVALRLYQDFKFKYVATWKDNWEMTGEQISEAITLMRIARNERPIGFRRLTIGGDGERQEPR